MPKYFIRTVLSLFISCFFIALVSTGAQAGKRVVLLIGNSDYKHVSRLKNPANDVKLLGVAFRKLGFEVIERRNVGYIGLKKAIREFTGKLKDYGENTVGFVFYAGHGLQVDGINYLVPVDAEIEKQADVSLYSVDAGALMQGLNNVGNRLNVIVLDSCRNNPYKTGTRSLNRGLARMDAPNGSLIAYSTSPGHVAKDGSDGNSPFSTALAEEITKPGVQIEIVLKRVRQRVFGVTSGHQLPWSSSSIVGNFCPAGCSGGSANNSTAPDNSIKDPAHRAWLTIKDTKSRRILHVFAKKYPDSLYAEFARIRREELKPGKSKSHKAPKKLILSEKRDLGKTEGDQHGRYFVIMGSFPRHNSAGALQRMSYLSPLGISAHIIDTNNYPNLTNGLHAVVMGPYNRDYAVFKSIKAKQAVPDAYIKIGTLIWL